MSAKEPNYIDIRCGSCEKTAKQEVVSEYTHTIEQEFDFAGETIYEEEEYFLRLSLCPTCESFNLSVEDDDGSEIMVLYPKPLAELEGLPEEIARAYKAARAVRLIDANAFAVLLGRVLEIICIDRNAKGKTLFEQLKDLAGRGEIPGPLADMADQLRNLR